MKPSRGVDGFRGFRFVCLFVSLLALGEIVYVGLVLGAERYQHYLALNAQLTGDVLALFGHEVSRESATITSDRCWFEVIPGCDGLQLFLLYACAVLAFPGSVSSKLLALSMGIVGVFTLNLIRLVSLYLTLAYVPGAYDTIHLTVWPLMLMVFVLVLWFFWAIRMAPRSSAGLAGKPS